jgi:hypothetical protein
MATRRRRRIGVTRDPELALALELTRDLLDESAVRSEAAHVRELALRGARLLLDDTPRGRIARDRAIVLSQPGVRPATRTLDDLPWLDDQDVDFERRGSALDDVRGD